MNLSHLYSGGLHYFDCNIFIAASLKNSPIGIYVFFLFSLTKSTTSFSILIDSRIGFLICFFDFILQYYKPFH